MYEANKGEQPRIMGGYSIDMRTGIGTRINPFLYRGPLGEAMPNVRAKDVKSFQELQASITPTVAGQGERIPYMWYHRVSYVSGTTTTLTFFNATGVKTTTNMQLAAAFPSPIYYQLYHLMVYFDIDTSSVEVAASTTNIAGAGSDIVNLSDGALTLNIAQKDYWVSPIWANPAGAGVNASTAIAATFTAESSLSNQIGTLGVPDVRNRNCFWGDITIPHTQNFSVVMEWAAAVTLNNGNTDIICALDGYLYRRVL